MRSLLSLSLLIGVSSAQFVFFGGNQFGSQQRFQPQPSFQQQSSQSQPSFSSSQNPREGRFSSTFFRGNAATFPDPSKAPVQAVAPVVPAAPSAPAAAAPSAPTAPAAAPKGNYQWEGKSYLLTWRTGRNNFAWHEGIGYCRSQGMKLISLDSREKADHFLKLVDTDRSPYFWAGGEISADSRKLTWQNGAVEDVRRGQHPWSFTGRTGPQPDGGERCLAVLNNVYRDGVKYHDVSCEHRKPVVCEE